MEIDREPRKSKFRPRKIILGGVAVASLGCITLGLTVDAPPRTPTPPTLTPEPTPTSTPELYSRVPADYGYGIIFNIGGDDEIALFTNTRPEMTTSEGMALVEAKDVFCPLNQVRFVGDEAETLDMKEFGCWNEFIADYRYASPERVVISTIQPVTSSGESSPTPIS